MLALSKNGQANQHVIADRPVSSLLGLIRTLQLVVAPAKISWGQQKCYLRLHRKKFHTLWIEIPVLKCCNKILFRIEKASFRKVVNFRKLAKSKDWFQKVNDFGGLIDRMIKSKILSRLESP